jgi:methionyl-tRNA synthetase
LGHLASTYLPADIFVRFLRLKGVKAYYVCATDDFGTPILIQAEREGKSPREFVGEWWKRDLEDFSAAEIAFDIFHQTSSSENVEFVREFFLRLYRAGHIYEKEVLQYYCEHDAKYLPDRYLSGTCPYCGAKEQYGDYCEVCGRTYSPDELKDRRCALCGREPVLRRVKHYFFRLSAFSQELRKWLLGNKGLQRDVVNYVLQWIDEGLTDWDITRDISWGVPIPLDGAEGQVLYGWFDNHLCYISAALKLLAERGEDGVEAWNASTIYHFIGKDIVYHHYLFLPAMRLADGRFKLPDYIPTRGHLLLQGRKISKSRRWYISLRQFLDLFPADYLRFYLAYITPFSQSDVNFDWDDFREKINGELIDNFGNYAHRVLSLIAREGGAVPRPSNRRDLDEEALNRMARACDGAAKRLEEGHLDGALRQIMEFSRFCNAYLQERAPWTKAPGYETALWVGANTLRALSIMLYPYIPASAERLWRQLDLEKGPASAGWDSAAQVQIQGGHRIGPIEPLFKRVEKELIEKLKASLGG